MQNLQISSQRFDRKLDADLTHLAREVDIIYSKVLRGQLRWFEAVSYLARSENVLTQAEYGYRGHRRENNLVRIAEIADYVLSRPPTVVPDAQFRLTQSISPEGFRGKIAYAAARRLMNKARALEDIQYNASVLRADVGPLFLMPFILLSNC
jgi:hypothetical protein